MLKQHQYFFQVSFLLATSRKIPNYKSSLKNIVFFHLVPVCQTDFNALPPKPDSLFAVPFLLRMFATESLNVTTTQMNAFVTKQTDTKTKVTRIFTINKLYLCEVYVRFRTGQLVKRWHVVSSLKSLDGQIRHSVANGLPLLWHFFEKSCVARAQCRIERPRSLVTLWFGNVTSERGLSVRHCAKFECKVWLVTVTLKAVQLAPSRK